MAVDRGRRGGLVGGIGLGGILVIVGIIFIILGHFWLGLIIALIGLIAFGGFARGRWY
jgi:CHASE2 domain-containing sensor protein